MKSGSAECGWVELEEIEALTYSMRTGGSLA